MRQFAIRGEYVTLGQLVKLIGPVQSGGEAKSYLTDAQILVNGEPENRRGRKLRPGDVVFLPGLGKVELAAEAT